MKKKNFVSLVMGTVGGILFALGMCMALLPEWGMFQQGIVAGVIGMLVLLVDLVIWRKMEGKEPIKLSGKVVGSIAVGVVGALLLGVGMCLTMVFGKMILGIGIGLVGIVVLLMLIPMTVGIRE
mgnify:FL=1